MKPLPDTSNWQPYRDKQVALRSTFLQTCRSIEARIKAESDIEKGFNIHNFDAGPGIEDIVRDQFRTLLPDRYAVTPGVIIDNNGDTCGDCDLVIANRLWSPLLKYGATDQSRRVHIPVEVVYTVMEVKQTLTESSLDEAMKKLVMYKRLRRDKSEYGRIVENHVIEQLNRPDASLNYRFDVVLAIGCEDGADKELVQRFFKINHQLSPECRVNALAILGHGYACYTHEVPLEEDPNETTPEEHLYPESTMVYLWRKPAPETIRIRTFYIPTQRDTMYLLYRNLLQHLSLTVLNFGVSKLQYGNEDADRDGYHPLPPKA